MGLHVEPYFLNLALPIGISFYTFHGMSYVFDIYRKKQDPVRNIVDYAVFVSFFPLLVAGPIERANHLLPQLQKKRNFNYALAGLGIKLIIWGLFKKLAVADNIAPLIDPVFENPYNYNSLSLVACAVGFSFQIYADFSGYTDIAHGVARLFGFELLKNFDLPYFSKSIPEFWKKWHISLSSWFRDYLYIPLGGSRMGKLVSIRNVMIVFLLSALWHGANWTYIMWGGIHAAFFIPGFLSNKFSESNSLLKTEDALPLKLGKILFTFSIVTLAWIFFRASSLHLAFRFISDIILPESCNFFLKTGTHFAVAVKFLLSVIVMLLIEFKYFRRKVHFGKWIAAILVTLIVYLGAFRNSIDFIYFQF
jgi:alginate O-acetyltransferase complex protein AlgI